jgi:hypothetical protein
MPGSFSRSPKTPQVEKTPGVGCKPFPTVSFAVVVLIPNPAARVQSGPHREHAEDRQQGAVRTEWLDAAPTAANLVGSRQRIRWTAAIFDYLRVSGDQHASIMGGASLGGWYIADFPSIPSLHPILRSMREKPRLRDLLRDLLGPYRLLSRSEVYIERVSGWHMDGLGCSGPMRSTMERSTTTGRLAPARLRGLRGQPRCATT